MSTLQCASRTLIALFQCGHTAFKVKGICVAHFLHPFYLDVVCPCMMVFLVASLLSRPRLPALCQDPRRPHVVGEDPIKPLPLLTGVECLADEPTSTAT